MSTNTRVLKSWLLTEFKKINDIDVKLTCYAHPIHPKVVMAVLSYQGLVLLINRQAKDVIKAIKKRVGNKHSNTQLYAVMLLEMLMNNIGEAIHRQVFDTGLLPVLVKIVKKKSDLPVREKIFLLIDATQTSLGGASGRFPQYYSAYYDLVSAGVQFPQRPHVILENHPTSNEDKKHSPNGELASSADERSAPQAEPHTVSESSIIQKANAALEVLREVIDAVDTKMPEQKDEFTLDLVEQFSFQKQRIMHVAITSRDEKVISRAIELNEQLQKVLAKHDALICGRSTSTSNQYDHEDVDAEEEAEQLFRRTRKGKACAPPEDEDFKAQQSVGMLGSSISGERLQHRPLIRPVNVELKQELNSMQPAVTIPPPPAKHVEREKFFQENKSDGSSLAGHVRSLSLHSREMPAALVLEV
ncbi:hypothetical protein RJ639_013628 [Escallonia herrerae]|uniref:Uncharacterized protein n=1 Tax=Escallonia herrerae TaxID=1293975 RepID=A0AA89AKP8_9ASTE|nr:hypothetical protein RJ639_013628 [Escallonia herrerae]